MKITLEIKETNGKLQVKVNELKRGKNTKDTEFNGAINVYNVICKALKEMEGNN